MKKTLVVKNLSVTLKDKHIVDDVSFSFVRGKTYVIMGPNGSGKSTFVKSIAGVLDEDLSVRGSIVLNGKHIEKIDASERARSGIFLSFQSPVAIPGVSVIDIVRASYDEKKKRIKKEDLTEEIIRQANVLGIQKELLYRGIHDGFSGGERKKIEILEAFILKPTYAFLDEVDTGLDVDALRIIGKSIKELQRMGTTVVCITHSNRIIKYLLVDHVLLFSHGKIVKQGDKRLVGQIEKNGYDKIENV